MRAISDERRDALLGRAGHLPQFFAGQRIEARDQFAAAEHHLLFSRRLDYHRRGVVRQLGTLLSPDFAAGFFVQTTDRTADFCVGLHHDDIAKHHRRTAITLMHFVFADRLLPKEFAVESQRRGVRLVADHEVHIQPLAIMNHGRPGVRRVLVQAHRKLALVHPGFPDRFAGRLV